MFVCVVCFNRVRYHINTTVRIVTRIIGSIIIVTIRSLPFVLMKKPWTMLLSALLCWCLCNFPTLACDLRVGSRALLFIFIYIFFFMVFLSFIFAIVFF